MALFDQKRDVKRTLDDATDRPLNPPSMTSSSASGNTPRPQRNPSNPRDEAILGLGITVEGEISGSQDLIILGKVIGKIDLQENSVRMGASADVTADVVAKTVEVGGKVKGNIAALERVVLKQTSRLDGNVLAPRMVLEEGAKFHGGIDMDEEKIAKIRPPKKPETVATKPAVKTPVTPSVGAQPKPADAPKTAASDTPDPKNVAPAASSA